MAAAFMFGGLIAVLPRSNRYANIRNLVTGSLCFIAALLSKESALIFPVLAILCLLFHTPPANDSTAVSRKRILVTLAPILVILGIYAVLRSTVLDFSTDAAASSSTLSERIVESLQSLALYIQLIFRPAHLHMERTLAGATTGTTLAGTAVLLIMAATFVAAFVTRRRLIALGIGWFTATWIPISGIFPLNAPMAEHWLYVPLGGFLLALFALAEEGFVALEKRVPAPALRGVSTLAVCTFVLFLFAKTIERNRDWRDNETLYVATLRENPNTIRIHYNLAVTYSDLLGNVPGAKRHYREVLRLYREKRKTDPDLAGI